ncbi:MAG: YqzL family protein [Clostridia bacterium]|nr:YqzL family protein [Clostridia bacterium]
MLKEFAWNLFQNTGNIDAYVFYKELEEKNKALNDQKAAEDEVAVSN